jgi:hypothetical protein
MEPQWNADRQVNARNRFARKILRCKNHQIRPAPIEIVSIGQQIAFVFAGAERRGSKYGFARRAVLETVLLDRAAFKVVLEQDIARRVARHGGRGDNVILELLECGRVSVAMRPADDSVIDARKLLKEPVTERPKSDFAADGIDGPAIEGNRAWSGHQRNIVTACVAAHVDANTVTIVVSIERMIFSILDDAPQLSEGAGAESRVSSPGESHPEALVEPYMSLSTHTAPIAEPCRVLSCQ